MLAQNLIQHHDRSTCVAIRKDKTMVTGSSDCTLLVWSIDVEEPASRVAGMFKEGELYVRPVPRHISSATSAPSSSAWRSTARWTRVCVSSSSRGQVIMHSLFKGSFVMHIHVATVAEVQAKLREAHVRANFPMRPQRSSLRPKSIETDRRDELTVAHGSAVRSVRISISDPTQWIHQSRCNRGAHSTSIPRRESDSVPDSTVFIDRNIALRRQSDWLFFLFRRCLCLSVAPFDDDAAVEYERLADEDSRLDREERSQGLDSTPSTNKAEWAAQAIQMHPTSALPHLIVSC